MDGWMDGRFAYAEGTTHCVNNDRVSCSLSSSWFSRLSPTRVDLGSRKGALCSRENRSDFRERQKGTTSSEVKQVSGYCYDRIIFKSLLVIFHILINSCEIIVCQAIKGFVPNLFCCFISS